MDTLIAIRLLTGAQVTGQGAAVDAMQLGSPQTFTGTVKAPGAVAVSAVVTILARNDSDEGWLQLGVLTMSGTSPAADGFASAARYMQYAARVDALSGAGAAVSINAAG